MLTHPFLAQSNLSGVRWPMLASDRNAAILALQGQFRQIECCRPDEVFRHQLSQIATLIRHAADTVPFYRDRLGHFANNSLALLTSETFGEVPILKKAELKRFYRKLVSRRVPKKHGGLEKVHTPELDGRPPFLLRTGVNSLIDDALTLRDHIRHGRFSHLTHVAVIPLRNETDTTETKVSWVPGIQTGDAIVLDGTQKTERVFSKVLDHEPAYLSCSQQMLDRLIEHSRKIGITPKYLLEVRTEGAGRDGALWRRCLHGCDSDWGVLLQHRFTLHDMATIAFECSEQSGHHIQPESVLVEVLDDQNAPCPTGHPGRVVITTLQNFAMPLLRYDIGIQGAFTTPCRCGWSLPLLRLATYPHRERDP